MAKKVSVEYEARAKCTGGREGRVVSSDGALDLSLAMPDDLTGKGVLGPNPEQLFAAAYGSAFIGAIHVLGAQKAITLPQDIVIDSSVAVGPAPGGFGLLVGLQVHIPDMDTAEVEALIQEAHEICSLSNALRNNVDVTLSVV